MISILRQSEYRRMPWKNGGGITTEIAIFPASAAMADFDWRVSMATVANDGPFSTFENIDRMLSILDGGGMRLSVAGRDAILLDRQSEPYAFAGDVFTSAVLTDGPIVDLNIMARRGRVVPTVQHVYPGETLAFHARHNLLLCRSGKLSLDVDGISCELEALDCLFLAAEEPSTCVLCGDGSAFLIGLDPV